MRHKCKDKKLGRSGAHRKALVSSLVCSLIERRRIKTTLAKAKQARSLAEKMVTLGRKGTVEARRRALSLLTKRRFVGILFDEVVPKTGERQGGYTRIVKLGKRRSDSSEMAILEWVDIAAPVVKKTKKKTEAKTS